MGELMTLREAAEYLGRSTGFVRALVADGLVGGRKRGGRWYVNRGDLEAWVRAGSVAPQPAAKLYVIPREVKVRPRGRNRREHG